MLIDISNKKYFALYLFSIYLRELLIFTNVKVESYMVILLLTLLKLRSMCMYE